MCSWYTSMQSVRNSRSEVSRSARAPAASRWPVLVASVKSSRRPANASFQERVETVELAPRERDLIRLAIAAGEPREEFDSD